MTDIVLSAADAIQRIPAGSRIFVPPFGPGPDELLAALGQRRWDPPVTMVTNLADLPGSLIENDTIRILSWQLNARTRSLFESGRIEYFPARYSDLARLVREKAPGESRVLLCALSFDESRGLVSPGYCASITVDLLEQGADLVIAQLSRGLPFTHTERPWPLSAVDCAIEAEALAGEVGPSARSAAESAAAQHVASLIPDEATLQFGIGGVSEAVLESLIAHRNLGIHSGMIMEGVVPLIESGAVTNSHKGLFDGITVTGLAVAGARLPRFLDHNRDVMFVPTRLSHGTATLVQLKRFSAINSAIEVDLSGQVNAEFLGGRQFSGVGGQADFAWAAACSEGGRSIVAMPATAGNGASRIVPALSAGAIVTSPRYAVDYVVTEYGAAALRFGTLAERARALIAIAHPMHRESLERALRGLAL